MNNKRLFSKTEGVVKWLHRRATQFCSQIMNSFEVGESTAGQVLLSASGSEQRKSGLLTHEMGGGGVAICEAY